MKKQASRKTKKAATRAKSPARKPVSWLPAGMSEVTPYLSVRGAARALDFYKRAFGARELMRLPMPDGRLGHAEMRIGGVVVYLADESPEMGGTRSPQALGGSSVNLHVYVKDVDRTFARAVAAGATARMPPTDMFWGDRYARLTDPFGHEWGLATHREDVPPREMARRAAAAMAQMKPGGQS
jgi:PhnB protein